MLLGNQQQHPQQHYYHSSLFRDTIEFWKQRREEARQQKLKEQQEMREMFEKYWPWSSQNSVKPRGLKNIRLEELIPDNEVQNAARHVGTLDLGRPGCGAPNIKDGRTYTKTKEDPQLRFQFGHDLRKAVDNNYRYKTDKHDQMEYRKELDKLVEEKQSHGGKERLPKAETKKHEGHSKSKTAEFQKHDSKRLKTAKPKNFKKNFVLSPAKSHYRLPPLSNTKENGVELAQLMDNERKSTHRRKPLCSTDVTNERQNYWQPYTPNNQGPGYLKELDQQISTKHETKEQMKTNDKESARRHFSTWESFWGKPGNGAPSGIIKKKAINRMLYPESVPVNVS